MEECEVLTRMSTEINKQIQLEIPHLLFIDIELERRTIGAHERLDKMPATGS